MAKAEPPPPKGAPLEARKAWELKMQKMMVAEDMKRDKAFRLGMIEDSGYICIGDPYQEPGKAFDSGSRTKGLNFKVSGTKKGQFGKGCFWGKLNPICIGDPYMSAQERNFAQKRADRLEARRLRIESRKTAAIAQGKNPDDVDTDDPPGWVPAPPKAEQNDIYLARVDKSTPDAEVLKIIRGQRAEHAVRKIRDEDGNVPTKPPNMKCAPMKTNIIDAVTQYPWMPAADDQEPTKAEKMKRLREQAEQDTNARPVFRPANPLQTNIIDAVHQYPWMPDSDRDGPTFAEKMKAKRKAAAEADDPPSPWRPSNPMKSSIFDMTSKFPEHIPNPDTLPKRKSKDEAGDDRAAFKPVGRMQSRPVYTVALNKRNLGAYKASFYSSARASMRRR